MQNPQKVSRFLGYAVAFGLLFLGPQARSSDQIAYSISNGNMVLIGGIPNILTRVENPKGGLILLAGGSQRLNVMPNGTFTDQAFSALIRNRNAFVAAGFDVLLADKETDLQQAVDYMARLTRPVTIVATSNATRRTAKALVQGAKPDKIILASGELTGLSGPLDGVADILGNPALLPPTLIVHHRKDNCRFTSPAGVDPFKAWARDRVRKVVWIDGGFEAKSGCASLSHHGFVGQDEELVSNIVSFAAVNSGTP